ncbi:MAG TPA: DUF4332 domain-containing protein [Gemmatimonadales bacterium]|nr:DUF4332 domain-containing protein [Gemmatimonadales bacterium]
MSHKITDIEGISTEHARKLEKAGVTTTEHLLAKAFQLKARGKLALDSGIAEKYLARWTAIADLMRVKGIGPAYSELLFAAGMDSSRKLLTVTPGELIRLMDEQRKAKKLVGGGPKLAEVQQWLIELRAPTFAHAK